MQIDTACSTFSVFGVKYSAYMICFRSALLDVGAVNPFAATDGVPELALHGCGAIVLQLDVLTHGAGDLLGAGARVNVGAGLAVGGNGATLSNGLVSAGAGS